MLKGWTGFAKYALLIYDLPAEFQALTSSVATAFGVTQHSPLATIVIDIDSVGSGISNKDVMIADALPVSGYLQYMLIVVAARKRNTSSTIAR